MRLPTRASRCASLQRTTSHGPPMPTGTSVRDVRGRSRSSTIDDRNQAAHTGDRVSVIALLVRWQKLSAPPGSLFALRPTRSDAFRRNSPTPLLRSLRTLFMVEPQAPWQRLPKRRRGSAFRMVWISRIFIAEKTPVRDSAVTHALARRVERTVLPRASFLTTSSAVHRRSLPRHVRRGPSGGPQHISLAGPPAGLRAGR